MNYNRKAREALYARLFVLSRSVRPKRIERELVSMFYYAVSVGASLQAARSIAVAATARLYPGVTRARLTSLLDAALRDAGFDPPDFTNFVADD